MNVVDKNTNTKCHVDTDSSPSIGATNDLPVGLHAHWDCFSGAAGDMMLAACLDAADSKDMGNVSDDKTGSKNLLEKIEQSIRNGLPDLADEFSVEYKRVWKGSGSIMALHVTVQSVYNHEPATIPPPALPYERTNIDDISSNNHIIDHHYHHHNHEHNHYHNSDTAHSHNHDHDESSQRTVTLAASRPHDHEHEHAHNHATHVTHGRVRNLPEIRHMLLDASDKYIPTWVRDNAISAFTALAVAEATVHGASSMDDVHFHEVGAIDSIVDTVGTLLALYYLNVRSVSCSRLPLGEGVVSTAHGILPVPAPATLQLMIGMPVTPGPTGRTGELVTPTAASLLRVLVQQPNNGRPPCMKLRKVGIGAGTKDFKNHPNIIRLLLGEIVDDTSASTKRI